VAETRLACRIDALGPGERARHRELVAEVTAAAAAIEELPEGYAIRFPARPYLFLRLAEWIELERAFCPFLAIGIAFENGAGSIRVDLRGPAGVKDFLRSQFPLFEQVR
jgi:hypothetical protein